MDNGLPEIPSPVSDLGTDVCLMRVQSAASELPVTAASQSEALIKTLRLVVYTSMYIVTQCYTKSIQHSQSFLQALFVLWTRGY